VEFLQNFLNFSGFFLKIFLKILISPKFFCKKFFLTQIFFEKFLKF